MKRPIVLRKAGDEWAVELTWDDGSGQAICGMFVSKDESAAKSYYANACRILDCWYVSQVWEAEGKLAKGPGAQEG